MAYVFISHASTNTQVTVTDIDVQGPAIAIPYRVHLDTGPGTGN